MLPGQKMFSESRRVLRVCRGCSETPVPQQSGKIGIFLVGFFEGAENW